MNHPNIVRYHTAWTETEDLSRPFSDAEADMSTQPSGTTLETSTDDSTEDTSDDEGPSQFDSDSDASVRPGDDLDIDLGLDDLDDTDFLSVGHSKSVSYPSIHFGNEGDVSVSGQSSPVQSRPATRIASPVTAPSPQQTRTLYIQVSDDALFDFDAETYDQVLAVRWSMLRSLRCERPSRTASPRSTLGGSW